MYPESLGGGPMYPQTWWDIWGGGYCIPKSGGGALYPEIWWGVLANYYEHVCKKG